MGLQRHILQSHFCPFSTDVKARIFHIFHDGVFFSYEEDHKNTVLLLLLWPLGQILEPNVSHKSKSLPIPALHRSFCQRNKVTWLNNCTNGRYRSHETVIWSLQRKERENNTHQIKSSQFLQKTAEESSKDGSTCWLLGHGINFLFMLFNLK